MAVEIFAQTSKITGRITNGTEPLPYATITAGSKSTLSNENGHYTLLLQPGTQIIVTSHAGYLSTIDTIYLKPSDAITINNTLHPEGMLNEVAVLGSRSLNQYIYKPVPVDILNSRQLTRTGQISITQMLQYVAPSFNTSRELLFESSTLRGLDPQHVIILVNGIRYHNSASINGGNLRGQLGRGSAGNDLNSIPFAAINKVEILRDGASAQYGSDAIAGVINIKLKNATNNGTVSLQLGQCYSGDGEKMAFGFNNGVAINKKGYLNYSGSMRLQEGTYRGGTYLGTFYKNLLASATTVSIEQIYAEEDSILKARGVNKQSIADNAGGVQIYNTGMLVNTGYLLNSRTDIFFTTSINTRKSQRNSMYRFPKDTRSVNTILYPDGLQPITHQTSSDLNMMGGIKFKTDKEFRLDISMGFGSNNYSTNVDRSNNASQSFLGKAAPTSFFTGRDIYSLWTSDIDFSKQISNLSGIWKSIHFAWGTEWRMENLRRFAGETDSWKNFDPSGKKSGGSQGSTGIPPENEMNRTRNVLGFYADVEIELRSRLLLDFASRYETYSDYGGNLAGKMALCYEILPALAVRASVNNGFRAPSLQQKYLNTVQNLVIITGGIPVPAVGGIFPNHDPLVKAFGVPNLKPETSRNFSGGIIAKITNQIKLSIDLYGIEIRDRIVLTGVLHKDIPGVKNILDSIPNLRVNQLQFFTNAIDSRTNGLDIAIQSHWDIGHSQLSVSLAANFTSTKVIGDVKGTHKLPTHSKMNALFNIEERTKLEDSQPSDKVIFSLLYQMKKLQFNFRLTRFGSTSIRPYYALPLDESYPQEFSPKWITDCNISWPVTSWSIISVGANNLFNVYPDKLKDGINTSQGMWIYSPEASPFGYNGGSYFASIKFTWN
jgi:iron complex outermembrane recepter protein